MMMMTMTMLMIRWPYCQWLIGWHWGHVHTFSAARLGGCWLCSCDCRLVSWIGYLTSLSRRAACLCLVHLSLAPDEPVAVAWHIVYVHGNCSVELRDCWSSSYNALLSSLGLPTPLASTKRSGLSSAVFNVIPRVEDAWSPNGRPCRMLSTERPLAGMRLSTSSDGWLPTAWIAIRMIYKNKMNHFFQNSTSLREKMI